MQTINRTDQERVLLARLAAAAGRAITMASLAPVKPTKAFQSAKLGDRSAVIALLDDLVGRRLVSEEKTGRTAKYGITDAGSSYLSSLPVPAETTARRAGRRSKSDSAPIIENPNLVPFQRAFLLLQLLSAPDRTLTEGQANKLPLVAKEDLELTGPLASQLRRKLTAHGYLQERKEGRSLFVTITERGLAYLATLEHHPAGKFTMTGEALNSLLAARGKRPAEQQGDTSGDDRHARRDGGSGVPSNLGAAAFEVFRELARERFSRDGMVPIFEVRREMAGRYGPAAARHDTLDGPLLELWRNGKIRLVSISDTRGASASELEESITDAYETLFYMEDADGHSGTR
ncbi:hypothetical protein [Humisphaera borealis]|uniref:Uncharacterized protein n=1 Tax=Humisphaera borealis TaxID=2807512 RepID=A0A7M2X5E2_9BACT|nr:hypothetical protein [Humisphaera borealis]QOV92020.1 hypothetical protein IPV69_11970 [Humisphaera borealis]